MATKVVDKDSLEVIISNQKDYIDGNIVNVFDSNDKIHDMYINDASEGIDIYTKEQIDDKFETFKTPIGLTIEKESKISGTLKLHNYKQYLDQGYVPYIWRYITKSRKVANSDMTYNRIKIKGWAVYGSHNAVNILPDGTVQFSTNRSHQLNLKPENGYSSNAKDFIKRSSRAIEEDNPYYGHGKRCIDVTARKVQVRYAIGFAKPKASLRDQIREDDLVSNLAEFYLSHSIISGYNAFDQEYGWTFSLKYKS